MPKILPQFRVSDSDLENLRGSCLTVNATKILRVLFFQSRFKTTKSTFLLLFSKASKLGFDSLCLCRVDVLSKKASISNIKLLTMSFKQKLPQFNKSQFIFYGWPLRGFIQVFWLVDLKEILGFLSGPRLKWSKYL